MTTEVGAGHVGTVGTSARPSPRGRGTWAAVLLIVAVLVTSGAVTYFALNAGSPLPPPGSCSPPGAPACHPPTSGPATVSSPFSRGQQGTPVPFTVSLPSGVLATTYTFDFGDGDINTSATDTLTHVYANPGIYYVYASAVVDGTTYSNLAGLLPFNVTSSFAGDTLGNLAETTGSITSKGAVGVVAPGGSVSLAGSVASTPTNPVWYVANVGFSAGGASDLSVSNTSWSVSGTPSATASIGVGATTPQGAYPVTFFAETKFGSQVAWSNFTFTIFVGDGAGVATVSVPSSPHRATLNVYELAPGGSVSEDPAVDYETVGEEPILNVFQTLISYNGSHAGPLPQDFVPNAATCVPGSVQCTQLYTGETAQPSLTDGTNYTFVLNASDSFYDPSSSSSYAVWPNDVAFSLARTCLFSTYPAATINPGWIQCQSLLPPGNGAWDDGLHAPYNNTPSNIIAAMTINGTDCPRVAGSFAGNGCITFNTGLSGAPWPEFLELVADPEGGAILSCGFLTAHGDGLPGWSEGSNCFGAPPGTTGNPNPTPSPTAWDSYMMGGLAGSYNSFVQWNMVGSGPYYMANLVVGTSYELKANPHWGGTTCSGGPTEGCLPPAWPAGATAATEPYHNTVSVSWETTQTPGETAYQAGTADAATIPSTDNAFMLQEVKAGKIGAEIIPTLSIFFLPINMEIATGPNGAQQFTSEPVNIPSDIMQDLAFRQFLIAAYPYGTIQSTYNVVNGVEYEFQYGGAIPEYMGNFYPTNITWDESNPSPDPGQVGGAAWWWAQVEAESNGIARSACTVASPCTFPFVSEQGAPAQDAIDSIWAGEVDKLSEGAVKIIPVDVSFAKIVTESLENSPGNNPMPMYTLGWAPDYPDPSDYVVPLYMSNETYTYGDAVYQALAGYNAACQPAGPGASAAFDPVVTQACQGTAYQNMNVLLAEANGCVAPACTETQRVLLYNMAEHIAEQLGLYVANSQTNEVGTYASWVNPASVDTNPMVGGASDQPWYDWSNL